MPPNRKIYFVLILLLVLSALARGWIAGAIELGNDEVYYWTYAKFPAFSHFDHPPMVGLAIQLFTLDLRFDGEFFMRLAAVIFGTLSTGLMFLIGKQIKNPLTGLYAAFLYTGSFYGFILSGTFILPDGPQIFFWLLTLWFLVKSLPDPDLTAKSRNFLFYAGISAGMAMLSKYHAVFLIVGAFFYILLYNRKWFFAWEAWGAFVLALLCFMPVVFWNAENGFISFTFHESRVGITGSGIQPQYFLTEMAGQFFYNNPVNVVIVVTALVAMVMKRHFLERGYLRLILWVSLPLLFLFLGFSLFRSTLPHWTGPAHVGLIFIGAAYLSDPHRNGRKLRLVPWPVVLSLLLSAGVVVTGVGQILCGWVPVKRYQVDDVSLDMVGWEQLGEKFRTLAKWDEDHFLIDKDAPLITFRWFPAANFDYYLARTDNRSVYALGALDRIHKYYWINRQRGNLKKGSDAWYVVLSDDYEDPVANYGALFERILPPDTLYVLRSGDTVRKAFVFRLIDLKEDLVFSANPGVKPEKPRQIDTLEYFIRQIRQDWQYLQILEKRSRRDTLPLETLIRKEAEKMVLKSREQLVLPDTVKKDNPIPE